MTTVKDFFRRRLQSVFRKNETALHPLTYLFWECTHRCNMACRHCGSDCGFATGHPDMPFEDFFNAVKDLPKIYGDKNITIGVTGGEPLMRKDLAECGKMLVDAGFGWGIVTNGYLYDDDVHQRLLSAGMGTITISLDGMETLHDDFRRTEGSFMRVMNAIDLIVKAPQLNYDIVTCVHKKNLHQLQEIKDLLVAHKVKAWRLFTIAPIGRAAKEDSMRLNGEEVKEMLEFIANTRKGNTIDIKFSCEAYTGEYESKVRDWGFFCRAGINIASVLIDGSISACPNINRSFSQGNIYKDKFIDVWENRFQIMRNREWMKCDSCANCKAWKRCDGGALHLWNENRQGIMECLYKKIEGTKN